MEDAIKAIQQNAEMQQKIWRLAEGLTGPTGIKTKAGVIWFALRALNMSLETNFPSELGEYHKRIDALKEVLRKEGVF